MDFFENIDKAILLLINRNQCGFCDFIFYWASTRIIWIPLYGLLAWLLYRRFGTGLIPMVLMILVLILLSDQLSVLIKNNVMRYRPCHHLLLKDNLNVIDGCGGMYGFVSSHATNSMALAAFLILAAGKRIRFLAPVMISWLLLVSYSRVYLGRHYPSDIVGGWILGLLLAALIFYFYKMLRKAKSIKT